MQTYIALLRGINVGGNNKVPMTDLKAAFAAMGYENVSTYINSGNVIFDAATDDFDHIEPQLAKTFGFAIQVLVRSAKNVQKVCDAIPDDWTNDKDFKTDVIFLWDGYASKKTLGQIATNPEVDTLQYAAGAIIWHLPKAKYGRSKMGDFIGTEIYKNMTARNVNTVRKLCQLVKERKQ